MNYNSFNDNVKAFEEVFKNLSDKGILTNVYYGLYWIAGIAVLFMVIKSYVKSTAGGQPLNWQNDILKPLLLYLVLLNWITIMGLIDTMSSSIGSQIKSVADTKATQENINDLFDEQVSYTLGKAMLDIANKNEDVRDKLKEHKKNSNSSNIVDNIVGTVNSTTDVIFNPIENMYNQIEENVKIARVNSARALADLGITIQNLVSILFFAYAKLILELLKIVGGIALILSLFPNMQQSFFSWLKNFIAVHMWFPIAVLIFYVIDLMYLKAIDIWGLNEISNVNSNFAGIKVADDFETQMSNFRSMAWIYIGFGIFKGILMFKIPNIVSMFVGSSSSSGGMFAAAFTPAKMAGGGVGKLLGK